MYVSTMESESYSWLALGKTAKESEKAIVDKWNSDKEREHMTFEELNDYYVIHTRFLKPGECECE